MNIEVANLIVQSVIAIAACIALRQLSLTKKTFSISSKRESVRYATELVKIYLNEIIPKIDESDKFQKEVNFKKYSKKPELQNFLLSEAIEDKNLEQYLKYYWSFSDKEPRVNQYLLKYINNIEAFATPFIEKVADEEVAFKVIGITFCREIDDTWQVYTTVRKGKGVDYFSNTIALYNLWSKRIIKLELKSDLEKTKGLMDKIPDIKIDPLGTK